MKNKKNILKNKNYVHFDNRKKPTYSILKQVSDREWVSKHAFYPFLHFQIKFNKYTYNKKENKRIKKIKTRDIYYSAHIDRYIYQYYANELNDNYNTIAKEIGINKVSLAYRNNLNGKCNIHFAKKVIDFISKQEKAFIYVEDFSNFFDNLNHVYLKEKICEALKVNKLPKEHYAIFKNITNFSYIEKEDILNYKGLKRKELNKLDRIFDTAEEFRYFKKINNHLKKHKDTEKVMEKIGIPQGTPISAVYANIYMIDFDKKINDFVTSKKGIYCRYCDDIIIVIPLQEEKSEYEIYSKYIKKIKEIEESIPNLDINEEKTSTFIFKEDKIIGIGNTNENHISYLGFYYDGKCLRIREKSLFKYYTRMYEKTRVSAKYSVKYGRKVFRKRLYKLYSHLGEKPRKNEYGNFLTYAKRADKVFGRDNLYDNKINSQIKRHWEKLQKSLNKNIKKYKC